MKRSALLALLPQPTPRPVTKKEYMAAKKAEETAKKELVHNLSGVQLRTGISGTSSIK